MKRMIEVETVNEKGYASCYHNEVLYYKIADIKKPESTGIRGLQNTGFCRDVTLSIILKSQGEVKLYSGRLYLNIT